MAARAAGYRLVIPGFESKVLLFGPNVGRSHELSELLRARGVPDDRITIDPAPEPKALKAVDLVVCVLDPAAVSTDAERMIELLEQAQAQRVSALVWGMSHELGSQGGGLIDCISADAGIDEVAGRLTALARYAPIVKRMEKELDRMQKLGQHLNRYFDELDQEMRLAGRLQHDFMPRILPTVERLRFAHLYRPAAWVSGDIFDVFRIDGLHMGMFIADAMGHGTAAGLMSMFLRQALVPMVSDGLDKRIVPPAEAMCGLHEALARQELPHAQFVTAAYAVIDVDTLQVRAARGGHPYPLHITSDGQIHEMRCEGGLLGVPGMEPEFDECRAQLAPGDKLIFYTDGLEELFIVGRDSESETAEFTARLSGWARLDAGTLINALAHHLDHREGSLNPEDDVTVVIAEAIP